MVETVPFGPITVRVPCPFCRTCFGSRSPTRPNVQWKSASRNRTLAGMLSRPSRSIVSCSKYRQVYQKRGPRPYARVSKFQHKPRDQPDGKDTCKDAYCQRFHARVRGSMYVDNGRTHEVRRQRKSTATTTTTEGLVEKLSSAPIAAIVGTVPDRCSVLNVFASKYTTSAVGGDIRSNTSRQIAKLCSRGSVFR